MSARRLNLAIQVLIWGVVTNLGITSAASPPSAYPTGLATTNTVLVPFRLDSLEAFRAEFRHLRGRGRELDVDGPERKMTGWQHEVLETQWPFMQFCYLGFAAANLTTLDPINRAEYLDEIRWLIASLQKPRLSGFVRDHFGPPFGPGFERPSVFIHGFFLNLLTRYRAVSEDPSFDPLLQRLAEALALEFKRSDQGILPTYRDFWWPTDNLPALSALVRYDRLFQSELGKVKDRYLRSMKEHYLDRLQLPASYIDPNSRSVLQGARGVSLMYALHFVGEVDKEWAAVLYGRARESFFRRGLGFAAVREFPEGEPARTDVDSGVVLFGLGTAASGFGLAAAAVQGDLKTAEALLRSSIVAGRPSYTNGMLAYRLMPPVGQAVLLFGKTEWLTLRNSR